MLPAGDELLSSFIDPRTGWALKRKGDRAQLYLTGDQGRKWEEINSAISLYRIAELQFLTPKEGWALAETKEGVVFLKTDNGGKRWERIWPQ